LSLVGQEPALAQESGAMGCQVAGLHECIKITLEFVENF
jgi:hypothetical protein